MEAARDAPPQIVVVYRGQKRVFGRQSAKQLGYKGFIPSLVKQFGLQTAPTETRALPGTINIIDKSWPKFFDSLRKFFCAEDSRPARLHATFRGLDEKGFLPVVLDESSWEEMMENILTLELSVESDIRVRVKQTNWTNVAQAVTIVVVLGLLHNLRQDPVPRYSYNSAFDSEYRYKYY